MVMRNINKTKFIGVRVKEKEINRYHSYSNKKGFTLSEAIRSLLKMWEKGQVEIDE